MGASLSARFRVDDGAGFRLRDFDPGAAAGLGSKPKAEARLRALTKQLAVLQDRLYAQDRWSVLLVFQAMDAAGKDGTVRHTMSGINPQGCQVHSFRAPSEEELDHDFLWRCARCLPERGRIGVFNRSHYEEVLIVRVHPELLERQRLPEPLVTKSIWRDRLADIAAFESYLARNGTVILKFFLNVSRETQKQRFLDRLDEPEKNWKFKPRDVEERAHWKAYMAAYEDAIRATAAPHAPWFVVPADKKWVTRAVVSSAIVERLQSLGLAYPRISKRERAELDAARATLMAEP